VVDDAHASRNSVEKMKSVVSYAWLLIEQVQNDTASTCLKFHLASRFRFGFHLLEREDSANAPF